MKKSSKLLGCFLLLAMTNVMAENTREDAQVIDEVPPPPRIVEGEPEITIRKEGKKTIEEYRINGELYMMKVTPKRGKPYYLHRESPDAPWVNIGPTPPLSIPHWTIFRF